MSVIERVEELEARTRRMEARLAALEGRPIGAPRAAGRSGAPWSRSRARPRAAPRRRPSPRRPPPTGPPARPAARDAVSLEDLLGGRVLAWAGGLSLLAGLLFLLVVAVSRGWIGEEARTALAAATSLGLLVGRRSAPTSAAATPTARSPPPRPGSRACSRARSSRSRPMS